MRAALPEVQLRGIRRGDDQPILGVFDQRARSVHGQRISQLLPPNVLVIHRQVDADDATAAVLWRREVVRQQMHRFRPIVIQP